MSLVRAQQFGDNFKILSDTKISDSEQILRGVETNILKVVILRPDLCIGFAGLIGPASLGIEKMDKLIGAEEVHIDRVLDHLLQRHLAAAKKTDFIVASLTPSSNLYKISEGKVESDLQNCWIGDHDAFSTYQEFFHQTRGFERPELSPESAENVNTNFRMQRAFIRLVESGLHESVGHFMIEVATNPGIGFYYEARYIGTPGPASLHRQIEPSEEISDWSASIGGFSTSILVPDQAGIGAIGIYFFQGKFGALFYPIKQEEPIVITNVDKEEFIAQVFERFGVRLCTQPFSGDENA
jgi:hypothetical protein